VVDPESKRPLVGRVAVVTGASRGAGRGIALELGAAGATVIVTGRSTREQQPAGYRQLLELSKLERLPGTIEDTAEQVTQAGGRGLALPCDHADEGQVNALFERVQAEHGRLDILVNNAWGGHESFDGVFDAPYWQHPLANWDSMFQRGVRCHLLAARAAAPAFVKQGHGLVAATTFWDRGRYLHGNLYYDLAKAALSRLAFGVAQELRPHGVASVALSPGWMRTEFVLAGHHADESNWQERPALARTESPRYLGRAVVALATDPQVLRRSGRVLRVGDLAREYGFTDIDGRQVAPFEIDEPAAPPTAAAAARAGELVFAREPGLPVAEFRRVLVESGLGATRPVDDEARLQAMLSGAGLVMTARLPGPERRLVGVARCLTDFSWNCYVSELAVSASAQGMGIGQGLLQALRAELGPQVSVVLAAVPEAVDFYERIGMPRLPDAFCWKRTA
jgi:NAD(P)-dependent dehydrogenase (short-subunit alcohol dehydrogenase family)/GNAT superfamily N-acetyltransferase